MFVNDRQKKWVENEEFIIEDGLLLVCEDCVCQFWGGVARGKREPVFLQ